MMTENPKKISLYLRNQGEDPISISDTSFIQAKQSQLYDEDMKL